MSTGDVKREDSASTPDRATLLAASDEVAGGSARVDVRPQEEAWPLQQTVPGFAPLGGSFPTVLGRFELRRELGRGGFGTVYLAHDPQLLRDVALKVPHAEVLADPELWSRFQREARAAAGLDHPHLVPVYEAGAGGALCYIASAYCPGPTLAAWLRTQIEPVPCSDAAQLVRTLAGAVQHAHERGVIHRDLKPSNILLQVSQSAICNLQSAIPKITDFGLAKALGDTQATRTGATVGTPCYMAPEQADSRGTPIGPAADVYALGVILYELLTGRTPFQADSPLATLMRVRHEEPLRPSQLRHRLPRDLETICLKCLEKEPGRRYSSAKALADDLGRYLEHRPIVARRVGPVGRLARGCRRKPVVAGLLLALLLACVGGVGGIVWQWRRAEKNAADLTIERDKVLDEKDRAERHLERARGIVHSLTQLGNELWEQPGLHEKSKAVLEEALSFYQAVLKEKGTDRVVRLETARACGRVGSMYQTLNLWDKASAAYQQQIALLRGLADEFPDHESYRALLAIAHRYAAHVLRDSAKKEEARREYDKAIEIEEDLLSQHPGSASYRIELANSLLNSVSVLAVGPDANERERRIRRTVGLQQEAVDKQPGNRYFQTEWLLGLECLAHHDLSHGRDDAAEAGFRHIIKLQDDLRANSKERSFDRYRARRHLGLAMLLARTGRRPEAREECRTALGLLEPLVHDYFGSPYLRSELAQALLRLRDLLQDTDQHDEVEQLTRKALNHYKRLHKDFPDESTHRLYLADTQVQLAEQLRLPERLAEVEDLTRRALAHYESLAARASDDPEPLRRSVRAVYSVGKRCRDAGDETAALRAFQHMLALNERLVARWGAAFDRSNRAWDLCQLSRVCAATGRLVVAEHFLRSSAAEFGRLAGEIPSKLQYRKDQAGREDERAELLARAGRPREAAAASAAAAAAWQQLLDAGGEERECRHNLTQSLLHEGRSWRAARQDAAAVTALRAAVRSAPRDAAALNALAWFLLTCPDVSCRACAEGLDLAQQAAQAAPQVGQIQNTLGVAHYRAGDYPAAAAALTRSVRSSAGGTCEDWFFLAMTHWQLGNLETARRWYIKAIQGMSRKPDNDELRLIRAEAAELLAPGRAAGFDIPG
jgi:tetratricopeptide (TPR) repeat protein